MRAGDVVIGRVWEFSSIWFLPFCGFSCDVMMWKQCCSGCMFNQNQFLLMPFKKLVRLSDNCITKEGDCVGNRCNLFLKFVINKSFKKRGNVLNVPRTSGSELCCKTKEANLSADGQCSGEVDYCVHLIVPLSLHLTWSTIWWSTIVRDHQVLSSHQTPRCKYESRSGTHYSFY